MLKGNPMEYDFNFYGIAIDNPPPLTVRWQDRRRLINFCEKALVFSKFYHNSMLYNQKNSSWTTQNIFWAGKRSTRSKNWGDQNYAVSRCFGFIHRDK